MSKRAVSDEFDGLDPTEKAAIKAALNRCRALVRQIESKLRNKRPEHFVDKLSLADFCASVERGCRCPQTEKASVGPHQTCCRREEGSEGAEPSAPPIIKGQLSFALALTGGARTF
jgi:glutathione S-transferase